VIDIWGVVANSLWILGLAVLLAVFSWARWIAHTKQSRLRTALKRPSIQTALDVGLFIFCTGLAATRGGLTTLDGAVIRFATANSLTCSGNSWEVWFMALASSWVTILTTNSPVVRTLRKVSLVPRSVERINGLNRTCGGLAHTALKKENGARFGRPSASKVEIHPIGRGTIEPIMTL